MCIRPVNIAFLVLIGYQWQVHLAIGRHRPPDPLVARRSHPRKPYRRTLPHLTELGDDLNNGERCNIPGMTIAGKPAYLFSSRNAKTVSRHSSG
jgi:hypothetical protein